MPSPATLRQLLIVCASLGLSASTSAGPPQYGGGWNLVHQFEGATTTDTLGWSVDGIGDINGDGHSDLIVGARSASPNGLFKAGAAFVYSGKTGAVMHQYAGAGATDYLGSAVAGIGDVDADGIPDYAVGAPGERNLRGYSSSGGVYVYSGATGLLRFRIDGNDLSGLGKAIAGLGDINSDGYDDLVVGAPDAFHSGWYYAGEAIAYSGLSGSVLHTFRDGGERSYFGTSVSGVDDLNGDGKPEILIGAPQQDAGGFLDAGSAFLYSGATGALLFTVSGQETDGRFGESVCGIPDVNSDGVPDFAAGAPYASTSGKSINGYVRVFSGLDGTMLREIPGPNDYDYMGAAIRGAPDLNGDHAPDLLVGAHGFGSYGGAFLFSGESGAMTATFEGSSTDSEFGRSLAVGGDLDADGIEDVLIGSRYSAPGGRVGAGAVYAYAVNLYLTASSLDVSASSGGVVLYQLDFLPSDAGTRYRLLGSASGTGPTVIGGIQVPLTNGDWLWDAMLNVRQPAVFRNGSGALDGNGDAVVTLRVPAGAATGFVGATFHFAAVLYIPSTYTGLKSSLAVPLAFLP